VNDVAFDPFDDHLLVTASQDTKAHIWRIPEGGLTQSISQPERSFAGHRSRLILVDYHPYARGVLLTVGADKDVKLWDVEAGAERLTLPKEHRDIVVSFSWNEDGSQLATFSKDKKVRTFDPRANAMSADVTAHEGTKGGRLTWLKSLDKLLTTGITKQSDREFSLWDPRNLGTPLANLKHDVGSSVILPYFDEDTHIIHLAGKGDGLIKMYEVTDDSPHFLALLDYKSNKPQSGLAFLPKKCCNVMECEVNRFVKLTTSEVLPISMTIPRQNKSIFQDDIFPHTYDGQPTGNAEEWFGGATNPPNKVSLEPAQN